MSPAIYIPDPGATWRFGTSVPSNSLGIDGDCYLRTTTGDVYQRATGTYAIVANLMGATGPAGTGTTWRSGSGAPSDALGADGDFYLNSANGDVYKRTSGTYSVVANIKGATGSTGTAGAAGQGVPTGGSTGQVLTKNSSTDYDTSWSTPSGGGGGLTLGVVLPAVVPFY